MMKVIAVKPTECLQVFIAGNTKPLVDFIVPDGFVAVATVIIELFQKYPKGIYVPGKEEAPPGGRRPV